MICTTGVAIEGARITRYHGMVAAEVVVGANFMRDFFGRIRDFVGGRAQSYESVLAQARTSALQEIGLQAEAGGANAVVGVRLQWESVGEKGTIFMVCASGTAVWAEPIDREAERKADMNLMIEALSVHDILR